jgi:cytochrome c-type biogenesis protein CcmH
MFPLLVGSSSIQIVFAQGYLNVDKLAEDFYCTCGCNMLLSVCETQMSCEVAGDMKEQLRTMITQGMDRDEIVDEMTSMYGNTVLSIPPVQGFTLALWYYPVIGGILGIFVITIVSRRRSNVSWRIDPEEVLSLNEEELIKQLDINETETVSSTEQKYDDLLKKKMNSED